MFKQGDLVTHTGITGLGVVTVEDHNSDKLIVRKGKEKRTFSCHVLSTSLFRLATEDESKHAKVFNFVTNHVQSKIVETMLNWLNEGGSDGVLNDCGCEKNEFYNYTCTCRTLIKLYHRFSVFTQQLRDTLDLNIEDKTLENGKHKTILHSGSYKENKHLYKESKEF